MWPWGHIGFSYLLYAGFARTRYVEQPTAVSTWALAVGAMFPDLVDKPLAWSVHVLPNGRSLGHSALIGLGVVSCLVLVASRWDRQALVSAFTTGYVSHMIGDALYPAIGGDVESLGFLLWPVVPPIEYETAQSFLAHLAQLDFGILFWFETVLFVLAGLVWHADGARGLPRRSWWHRSESFDSDNR